MVFSLLFSRVRLVACVLMATWAMAHAAAAEGKRVALVIGNAAYKHAAPLINPANDARDMAAIFEGLGFAAISGFDLDHRGLMRSVRQFTEAAGGAETAVLFYAGHSVQVAGVNYLVPVDAELSHELEVDAQTVRLDALIGQMERSARTSIVFLDACRDNPLARTLARSLGTRSAGIGKGLAAVQAASVGTFIAFATAPNDVALDGHGRNSPFTAALKRHIVQPGKDLSAIMIGVRNDVIAATQDKQVPWENSALRAQFYFLAADGTAPAVPVSVAPAAVAPAAGSAERQLATERPDATAYSFQIWPAGQVKKSRPVSTTTPHGPLTCIGGRGSDPRRCDWK